MSFSALTGDVMSLALVALLALAQINLLSPVNTPFPGRIWASDTFIFSGIWENTRGRFLTFRQTTGMSLHVLVFPSLRRSVNQFWPVVCFFTWCRKSPSAKNTFFFLHNMVCDLDRLPQSGAVFLTELLLLLAQFLSQGRHPFLRKITHQMPGLVLLFSWLSAAPCVLWLVNIMNKRDFPLGMLADRFSVHTNAQNWRQNAICQLRTRWNIYICSSFGWITWPSFIQSFYQSSKGDLVNIELECQPGPPPHTCIMHRADICFLNVCRQGLREFSRPCVCAKVARCHRLHSNKSLCGVEKLWVTGAHP